MFASTFREPHHTVIPFQLKAAEASESFPGELFSLRVGKQIFDAEGRILNVFQTPLSYLMSSKRQTFLESIFSSPE